MTPTEQKARDAVVLAAKRWWLYAAHFAESHLSAVEVVLLRAVTRLTREESKTARKGET